MLGHVTAPPASPAELTVDQLAQRSGTSVRTIRFYTGRGLLPPPRLRGRTGFYGPEHLARLELIRELSELGLTLSAIETYLRRVPPSAGPEDLALQLVLLRPWVPELIEEVSRAELDRRAGRELSEHELEALQSIGIIERLDDGRVRLHGPHTLRSGVAMLDSGLPLTLWQRVHQALDRHVTALADEFMAIFQEEVLQPYRDRGKPANERTRLAEALTHLKPITVRGVVTAFGRAVNRAIRARIV